MSRVTAVKRCVRAASLHTRPPATAIIHSFSSGRASSHAHTRPPTLTHQSHLQYAQNNRCQTESRTHSASEARRLASANRSHVSIRGRPCKNFHPSTAITKQHSVSVSHTVDSHVGGTKYLGEAGAPPPWDGGRGSPRRNTLLPHTSYRTQCRRPRSNSLAEIRVRKNFWGRWGCLVLPISGPQ